MANVTIGGLTLASSAAAGDWLEIETAAGLSRKITKANLIGATITGGGTLALGGFTLTVGGNSSINGSIVGNISGGGTLALGGQTLTVASGGTLALGGFTLTVPATGTAALLATAQTFSALKTFSAGLRLGAGTDTLQTYAQGPHAPVITGSGSNPTITYSTQQGRFLRIGDDVFYYFRIIINTISGGGGDLRVSLPIPAADYGVGNGFTGGVDWTVGTAIALIPIQATSHMLVHSYGDNINSVTVTIAGLAAGDFVGGFVSYPAA